MSYKVTLIPGDGTGPEIADATRRVLEATGVAFDWEIKHAGIEEMERSGEVLPKDTLDSVRRNKIAIKGPITTPIGKGFRSVNVALRKELDLYACLRPCHMFKGVRTRYDQVDLVIVRENTESLYAGVEFKRGTPEVAELIETIARLNGAKIRPDSGITIKSISETATRRIATFAFEYARANKRRKVTAVHKANILKFTDGLFLEICTDVAKNYPDIEYNDVIVDNMCMQLVQKPEDYDILVLPNLYGDILSDLCAGLVGGLGVAPGGNIGDGIAVFEPTHGSAPKYAGKNKVNPLAMILSGVMMLRYLKEFDAATRLENAIAKVIEEGKYVTYDMKLDRKDTSAVGTKECADGIIRELKG
jgi:isocitrate dehydrogenase (NAD+)